MIRWIVKLSYHYFKFDNAVMAMDFAETAKRHYLDKKDNDLDVEISIVFAEPVEVEATEEE